MGLGGYLTWTAVAREICKAAGVNKVFPFEQHGSLIRTIKTSIFDNNPYIQQDFEATFSAFPMQLNHPASNYCKQDTPQKAIHRYDKHIIEQICEFYGIKNPELKCEIYLKDEEKKFADDVLKSFGIKNNFIVIEPQSNDEYTVNKLYSLQKWQTVVDELVKSGETVIQIGKATKDFVLTNTINLTGKTNFREAASIISRSKLFVSSEGGLMHASNAVGIKSVILFTGFIHPKMTGYPENKNIWIGQDHGPCGMKTVCEKCSKNVKDHDPLEIVDAAKDLLK
jgi:ADP-heptose:LPS heptosyltransferase